MTRHPIRTALLVGLAWLAVGALAQPAAANNAYTTCRVLLDAEEPAFFAACAEPLMESDQSILRNTRARLEESQAMVDRIIAQGGRQAATACAQSRFTLADLEREIARLRELRDGAEAMRDRWREAAGELAQARGAKQLSWNAAAIAVYTARWRQLAADADGVATTLRSSGSFLVSVDPAGLCVGQPPPTGSAAAPAADGFRITGVVGGTVVNRGARRPLVVQFAGTPRFPLVVVLQPRPTERGGCFDGAAPPGWRCGGGRYPVARATQPGRIEVPGALWCSTTDRDHRGVWTMRFEVVVVAGSAETPPQAVDITCDANNIPAR